MERRFAMIQLKRVYDAPNSSDGARFLVERLWPRGIRKTSLKLDAWLKDVAPSTELRKWFVHDASKWNEFKRRYFVELDANPAAWRPLVAAARKGRITLLFSSRDAEHNNALAVKDYLEAKVQARSRASHR
jgi:uncharacterized protein YeaO (DUF488 family)